MPTKIEHLKQAMHNTDVSTLLGGSACSACDWEVTTLFYSVVHLIEAKMGTLGLPHNSRERHKYRKQFVHSFYRQVAADYDALYTKCRRARYDCIDVTPQHVADARKRHEALRKALAS